MILCGHGRWEAAKEETVPVFKMKGLTSQQKLALMLFDNKSNLKTGFNAELFEEIVGILREEGFPLTEMGFLPEVFGESTGDRKVDENKLKESYDKYINGEIKRLVLYFGRGDLEGINQRIEMLMHDNDHKMKGDLVKGMLLEYEREHGML